MFDLNKENENKIEDMNVKNEIFNEENEDINEKNEEKNDDINEKNEIINEEIEDINEKNVDLNEKIQNLKKENKDLKEKLRRYPYILEKGEKLMSIIVSSRDEKIHYSLICKNNNTIIDIEKELYKEFPEYSKTKNIFLYKGKKLNKLETFQKSKIKNGDILILEQLKK